MLKEIHELNPRVFKEILGIKLAITNSGLFKERAFMAANMACEIFGKKD